MKTTNIPQCTSQETLFPYGPTLALVVSNKRLITATAATQPTQLKPTSYPILAALAVTAALLSESVTGERMQHHKRSRSSEPHWVKQDETTAARVVY
jgi:hypothetical protein